MYETFGDDYDCWEWFQSGKENILRSLARKNATNGQPRRFSRPRSNFWSRSKAEQSSKLQTKKLVEILNLQPLGMFLYLLTETEPDFFMDQIEINDDMERVMVYTRILVILCELELPGFHNDILSKMASCTPLLEHYEEIVRKLCTKSYRTMWTDIERVDGILSQMQTILLQAQRADVLDKNAMQILFNIWTHLKQNNNPTIANRPICIQFLQQLHGIFSVDEDVLAEPNPAAEIYPSLDELQMWLEQKDNVQNHVPKLTISYISTIQYINSQRLFLRQQFLLPLREVVRVLHKMRSLPKITSSHIVAFEDVKIRLNLNFPDANRRKLLYINIRSIHHEGKVSPSSALLSLKIGALLCLSTSYDFRNLILATVAGIDTKQLHQGIVPITIVRQYNIGNIYNKTFIMFETPVYFEPYQMAYRYLTNSNVINFPMSDYIVQGLTKTQSPAYLQQTQPPNVYESQKFANKLRKMPLNDSQRETFEKVLRTNFNLIQGPPGTGKTHLSLQLIKTMLDHAKFCAPIVVITYTNDSLDKFLLKLSPYTNSIVRFGCQSRLPEVDKFNARADTDLHMINPRLKRLYWMVNLEIKEQFKCLQTLYEKFDNTDEAYEGIFALQRLVWNSQEKLSCIRMIFQHYLVVKKNVLAMTTTCAARMNYVFRFLKLRIVIFEEAAEILEAHILPCLTPYTEHVTMIGDHMQLQPYTTHVRGNRISAQSLFERLIRSDFHLNILNIQYRMRKGFAALLCPHFYQNLVNHESVYKFPPIRNMTKNLYFLQHQEPELQVKGGFLCNNWEADRVVELLRYLVEAGGYTSKEVVGLSPYKLQVEIIKSRLLDKPMLKDIAIATVDSFQGLEADIIVLSLVRSNKYGNIGFLAEDNRICVALSRARCGLYIIGNMKILAQNSSTFCELQQRLKQQNAIGCEFPYKIRM